MDIDKIVEGIVFSLPKGYTVREGKTNRSVKTTTIVGDYVVMRAARDGYFEHSVYAKRLDKNGQWKDDGKEIFFHLDKESLLCINPENIVYVKKMKRVYSDI